MNGDSKIYCLDTSAIVDAWTDQPIDIFESLWQRLDDLAKEGRLISPEEVRQELRYPENLKTWAAERDVLFHELEDDAEQMTVTRVVDRFRAELKRLNIRMRPTDFQADPFVVALAQIKNATVVMHEKKNPEYGRPKIPNVADWYGVRSIRFLEFLREIGFRI